MTVLVTGATGFLGRHLVDVLVERGERPRVLVRPGESLDGLGTADVEVCRGDLADRAALAVAVDGVERVLHCAARTGPWGAESEYRMTNVEGLRLLAEVSAAAGIRRLVHVSSITVHGNDVGGTADEAAPFRSEPNPYSRSKIAGERLLERLIAERELPATIVRPGWIYGPRDAASFGRFAELIERGRMVLFGSGTNHLPLIYVRDVADGILLAGEAEAAVGRAYLLVNDEPVTQRQYLDAIAAELGVPPPRRRLPYRLGLFLGGISEAGARAARLQTAPPLTRYGVRMIGGENRFLVGRARSELGFAPSVGVSEGVRRSVEWYRSQRGLDTNRRGRGDGDPGNWR